MVGDNLVVQARIKGDLTLTLDTGISITVPVDAKEMVACTYIIADREFISVALRHACDTAVTKALQTIRDIDVYPEKEKS